MQEERPERPRLTLLAAGLRSLFLESSWNDDGQQNLGRAWVEEPALRAMKAEGDLPPSRLLEPFNTNPVVSGLVLGASLSLAEEARDGSGRSSSERKRIVSSMSSVAGGMGDQIFWNTWLPFSSLCGFLALWATGSWKAAFIGAILFSALAIPARLLCFRQGMSKGKDACNAKAISGLLAFRRKLHSFCLFLAGAATVLVLDRISASEHPGTPRLLIFAGFFLAILAVGARLSRGRPVLKGPVFVLQLGLLYLFFFHGDRLPF
jgi:mannose/fructose/N-acetylgalactosamine-specific phosphotransferase system component IID